MRQVVAIAGLALAVLAARQPVVRAAEAPPGTKVYVTNSQSDAVTVIDANGEQQPGKGAPRATSIDVVDVGSEPRGIVASGDGRRLYVANRLGSIFAQVGESDPRRPSISVIDATSDVLLRDIELSGLLPVDLVVSPDGTRVYVACSNSSAVSVVDTANNVEVTLVALPTANTPTAIGITPDGSKVYVAGSASSTVDVIATATNTVVAQNIPVVANATGVAVSSDGATVIVVGDGSPTLINVATDTVVATGFGAIGPQTDVVVVGNFAYVSNSSAVVDQPPTKAPTRAIAAPGGSALDIYNLSARTYIESIGLDGNTASAVTVLPDGSCAYVAFSGSNEVRVVDLVARTDTGESTATSAVPRGITLVSPATVNVPSYFLPKTLKVKLKDGANDTLVARGTFDDGVGGLDFTQPVTLDVGGFSQSFTLIPKGTAFVAPKEAGIGFTVKPNVKGSSRGAFILKMTKLDLDGVIDPDALLLLRLTIAGAPAVRGRVKLVGGFFRIGRARGDIVEPAFFPRKATATLADGAKDSLSLQGGFDTGTGIPETISDVTIAFGDTFARVLPASAFTKKGSTFSFNESGDGGSKLKVKIDFLRNLVTVTAKNIELGALDGATIDIQFGSGATALVATNSVRLSANGKKRRY